MKKTKQPASSAAKSKQRVTGFHLIRVFLLYLTAAVAFAGWIRTASATRTSDAGVRAILFEARREEAVGPPPTTTSNAASDERVRAKAPRFGWRRLYR